MTFRFPTVCLALLCAIGFQGFDAADADAKLLSVAELKSCKMHVTGIYSPKDHGKDDRVFVQVKPSDEPIVLVLSGYFGAQWNVEIAPKADVRQIIVAGYFEHSVAGVPDDIPIEMISYFPKGENSREDYFWAYSWHTQYGRELRKRLKEITGLEIATFQGAYSGERFVVDGKRGLVSEMAAQTERPPRKPSVRSESALNKIREGGRTAKMQRAQLVAQFGENHPSVKQIDKIIEMVEAELNRLGAAPIDASNPLTQKPQLQNRPSPKSLPDTDQRKIIETLVRQSFQLQTELQKARVEKAETDLQRIKTQLQQRQKSAEAIIRDRVEQLVASSQAKASEDADQPASLLSAEGWTAWQKRDWRTALQKFQAALSKEADNEAARNGLGWTYVHLQDYDQAISEFKIILKDAPTHPGALNGLGQSLLALGRLDDAERELLKATEDLISELGEAETVRRGATASWYGLIRTYIKKGDDAAAMKWAQRYLKHKPDDKMIKAMLEQAEAKESE